jgi:hypothetical protein
MKIDMGDTLDADAPHTLEERADVVDKHLREAGLYRTYAGGELMTHVDDLKTYAKTGDRDVFDVALHRIYDWCDDQRVWIEPASTSKKRS